MKTFHRRSGRLEHQFWGMILLYHPRSIKLVIVDIGKWGKGGRVVGVWLIVLNIERIKEVIRVLPVGFRHRSDKMLIGFHRCLGS